MFDVFYDFAPTQLASGPTGRHLKFSVARLASLGPIDRRSAKSRPDQVADWVEVFALLTRCSTDIFLRTLKRGRRSLINGR